MKSLIMELWPTDWTAPEYQLNCPAINPDSGRGCGNGCGSGQDMKEPESIVLVCYWRHLSGNSQSLIMWTIIDLWSHEIPWRIVWNKPLNDDPNDLAPIDMRLQYNVSFDRCLFMVLGGIRWPFIKEQKKGLCQMRTEFIDRGLNYWGSGQKTFNYLLMISCPSDSLSSWSTYSVTPTLCPSRAN